MWSAKRFIESYLQHIRICDASEESPNSSKGIDGDIIWPAAGADHDKCGECNELVHANDWVNHIAKQHNYLAKKVGETPLVSKIYFLGFRTSRSLYCPSVCVFVPLSHKRLNISL